MLPVRTNVSSRRRGVNTVLPIVSGIGDAEETAWEDLLGELRELFRLSERSIRDVADEIGITHGGLSRILRGETTKAQPATQAKIARWVREQRKRQFGGDAPEQYTRLETAERELLEYFMENFEHMATFLTTTTETLDAEDRRKVALAILNGMKRLAIEAGEKIPPEIYEMERRFVAE